ncbi:30S ribosomal protein S6 [Candidatus Peregrinibacteria bacterium CG10_big_fil_rev_8_21_14_0_10_49_24]|nr:MAG: 30S ribosomal protein S6 [Candidatus Peregrinibacteria bacterium CG11_big_fil_rev_8_21_14_0_20_49_14]PIR51493.1 MAG: 30S ribosomal protein S6 [Candidatus Peregrinibacteria bacterium CG10_big_fil_rev_8_21_14_0_10_49_24]PJA67864.1 MAG: 30S ribosomal protein S6 [Candidatus Peregrinibacteria bacterium CG_4_9_14_3_um_filter_49_12]
MPILTPSSEDVRIYEVAVLYPYPINQKEEQLLLKEVEQVFTEAGGKQVEKDVWGNRGLAYSIGGHTEGNFVIYYYEMDPSKIKEVDEALLIIPNLLRHLIVKPPKDYQVLKYSDQYSKWLKERETETQKRERETEEALKKKVADRAKRQAKRAEEQKKETEESAAPIEKKKLTAELDKIISDDELDL